jgi:putative transcriptional regulator
VTTAIILRLDEALSKRNMTLVELSRRTGVSTVNLSLLKNNHAKAVRFSTLAALCDALDCTPGELLDYQPGHTPE